MKLAKKTLSFLRKHALALSLSAVAGIFAVTLASCNKQESSSPTPSTPPATSEPVKTSTLPPVISTSEPPVVSSEESSEPGPYVPGVIPVADADDFTLDYYDALGGYLIGDYRGPLTEFEIPAKGTRDGLTLPIVGVNQYAFFDKANITRIDLGPNIRVLGENAFANCTNLTHLYATPHLFRVGLNAFSGTELGFTPERGVYYLPSIDNPYCIAFACDTMADIVLNMNCQSVADNSLDNYGKPVPFPAGILSIGDAQWEWDYSTLPDNSFLTLYHLGDNGLANCTHLGSLDLQDSDSTLGKGALKGCANLTSATMVEGLTTINDDAFNGCAKLGYLKIPSTVTTLGKRAFSSCEELGLGSLPAGLTSIGESCFYNCKAITKMVIPEGIPAIPDSTFENCVSLTSLTLPEIISIGDKAFSNCRLLRSVTFPATLVSIGEEAFAHCSTLSELSFPAALETISKGAFNGCTGVKSITFPDEIHLAEIPDEAFRYAGITSLHLPRSVTYIGKYAFQQCKDLTTLTFAGGTGDLNIAEEAFAEDTALTSISLPKNLYSLGKACFAGCEALTEVNFAANTILKYIGESAFQQCRQLPSIALPDSVVEIGEYAFTRATSLTEVAFGVNPQLKTIKDSAFYNCTSLASISLPETVTSLETSVFGGCVSLETFTLPSSMTYIPSLLLQGCESLTSVIIPEGVTSIGWAAFSDCTSLANLNLPASVTELENDIFKNCPDSLAIRYTGTLDTWLAMLGKQYLGGTVHFHFDNAEVETTEISWPSSIVDLPDYAFAYTGIVKLNLPASLASIGRDSLIHLSDSFQIAYRGSLATWLSVTGKGELNGAVHLYFGESETTAIEIPDSITRLAEFAFKGCSSLTSITLPSTLTAINTGAFNGCSSIVSLTIPGSVATLGDSVFRDCSSLKTLSLPSGAENLSDGLLANCSSLEELTISNLKTYFGRLFDAKGESPNESVPSTLKRVTLLNGSLDIPASAFAGIASLESVILPSSMSLAENYIGNEAFRDCVSLTSISFPSNLYQIDVSAFQGCTSLASVSLPNTVQTIGANAFKDCPALLSLDLPKAIDFIGENAVPAIVDYFGAYADWLKITGKQYLTGTVHLYFDDAASEITSFAVPSATSLPDYAFYNCKALSSITLPDGLKTIGKYAFYGCPLTETALPSTLTGVGEQGLSGPVSYAGTLDSWLSFAGKLGLANCEVHLYLGGDDVETTSLEIPYLGTLPDYAFYNCVGLETITYKAGLEKIGSHAFDGTTALQSFIVPASITSIGDCAFASSGVKELTFNKVPEGYGLGNDVFKDCTSLAKLTVPDNVPYLGGYFGATKYAENTLVPSTVKTLIIRNVGGKVYDNLARNCAYIENVTIEDGITIIGNSAFESCTSLKTFVYPSSVTAFYSTVFENCRALESFTLTSSVTNIGQGLFQYCSGLTSVTLPEGFTSIDYQMFYGCSSLTDFVLPSTINSIDYHAFYGCTSLPTTTYGGGIYLGTATNPYFALIASDGELASAFSVHADCKVIGHSACEKQTSLTSLTLPAGLRTVGSYAFSGCGNLISIEFNDFAASIGYCSFSSCTSLTSIIIPSGATVGSYAFTGCSKLQEISIPNMDKYLGAYFGATNKEKQNEKLPTTLRKVTVGALTTALPDYAFYAASRLTTIVLEGDLTSIGEYAFAYCSSLSSCSIPSTVTKIGDLAFKGASRLPYVAYEGSGQYIGNDSDPYIVLVKLESNVIAPSCRFIMDSVAYQSTEISSLALPDGLLSIGRQAFYGATKLNITSWPSTLKSIGSEAFSGCTNLTSIDIGNLETLGSHAFNGCTKIASLTLPSTFETIPMYSFYNLSSLTSLRIPASVTKIEEYAFYGCSSLASLTFESGSAISDIGKQAFYNTKIGALTLPSSIRNIGESAFNGNRIVSLTLPEGLLNLGNQAFYNSTYLTDVSLPSSLQTIGDNVFGNSSKLNFNIDNDLYYLGNTTNPYLVLIKTNPNKTVYVVTVNASCKLIAGDAFSNNLSMTQITIRSGVTYIGAAAFSRTTLLRTARCGPASKPEGWLCTFPAYCTVTWGSAA